MVFEHDDRTPYDFMLFLRSKISHFPKIGDTTGGSCCPLRTPPETYIVKVFFDFMAKPLILTGALHKIIDKYYIYIYLMYFFRFSMFLTLLIFYFFFTFYLLFTYFLLTFYLLFTQI